ncbi:MAG TPA: PDZ domain-containing protein, partial [Draconibacterium sp.]|nr:PDZ domain-containing protein [Draconibacterium sp.]
IKLPFVLNKSGAFCVNLEMDIEVDGMSNHIEGIFLLDLGYPRKDILINPTFFSKIDAENHEDLYYYEIGKQKPRIEYSFKAQKITFTTLNNVIYNNIKLTEYPRFIENYLYEPYAGVIGVEIFENYKIAIDYASKFLYLKPCLEKNTILEETSYKKWGITLRPEKTYDTKKPSSKNWVVSRIKKNGIAWEEGINLSDELLYIDNQPKQNFEQDFLVLKILNQSNTITIKKGNSSIVVLK